MFVNAREMAPEKAYRDMYNSTDNGPNESSIGVRSIGVPGELAGYWHMYQRYGSGNVTWERLFKDAIEFAKNGFPVGKHLHATLEEKSDNIFKYKSLHEIYVNPETGKLYRTDDKFKQPKLAETLTNISKASNGHKYFYEEIAQKIIYDLNNHNDFPELKPLLQLSDFKKYEVIEEEAFKTSIKDNITLHTNKLPGNLKNFSYLISNSVIFLQEAEFFYHLF